MCVCVCVCVCVGLCMCLRVNLFKRSNWQVLTKRGMKIMLLDNILMPHSLNFLLSVMSTWRACELVTLKCDLLQKCRNFVFDANKFDIFHSPCTYLYIHKFYHQLTVKLAFICSYMFQLRIATIFRELQMSRHVLRGTEFIKCKW